MASTLTSKVSVNVDATLAAGVAIGNVQHDIGYRVANAMADGAGLNQANQVYSARRTLAASANESIDLSGSLTNAFGTSLTFTKIKALIVAASAANTNDVIVGGAATNGFISWVGAATDTVKVKPGGVFVITAPTAAGLAVTAGTADLLKVANSAGGTGVTYDIIVIGSM